jgi:PIN domain nuclease of toxin-antitoxin system
LSARAISAVDDRESIRLASVTSIWEMAIKIAIGKLNLKRGTLAEFVQTLGQNEIELLPVITEDALHVLTLPLGEHKDPFDRLIAAQCLPQGMTLVSIDAALDQYGVDRIW